MKPRIAFTTSAVVVIAVGAALILTHGSNIAHSVVDAIAIMILVTTLSLQTWLRDKLFRPAEVPLNRARRLHSPRPRRQDRTRQVRMARVTRGMLKDKSAAV